TKRDVLRIELELRRLQIDIINRDNEVAMNFQKLASLVGMDREDLEKQKLSSDGVKLIAPVSSNIPDLKLADHRQFLIYQLRQAEADLETDLVRREYWPRVDLKGEVGYLQ